MEKHHSTQHRLEFQECHVSETPHTSATASQRSSTSVTMSKYPVILTRGRLSRFKGSATYVCRYFSSSGENKSYFSHSRARLIHLHSRQCRHSVSSQRHICYSCMSLVQTDIHLYEPKRNRQVWENRLNAFQSIHQRHRVVPQSCSSVRSPQSSTPSHFQNMGLHNPFLQVIAFASHSGGKHS